MTEKTALDLLNEMRAKICAATDVEQWTPAVQVFFNRVTLENINQIKELLTSIGISYHTNEYGPEGESVHVDISKLN